MRTLKLQHGKSATQALEIIKPALERHGYHSHVDWHGHNASASVGFGRILRVKASVTNGEVFIEFGGILSETALSKCRGIAEEIFPNGAVSCS